MKKITVYINNFIIKISNILLKDKYWYAMTKQHTCVNIYLASLLATLTFFFDNKCNVGKDVNFNKRLSVPCLLKIFASFLIISMSQIPITYFFFSFRSSNLFPFTPHTVITVLFFTCNAWSGTQ